MTLTSRLEHFDGASRPSGFVFSGGSGASDTYGSTGYAVLDRGASGVGCLLTLDEDIAVDEFATIEFAMEWTDADFRTCMTVADYAGAVDATVSQATLEARTMIIVQHDAGGLRFKYWNASGTETYWNGSSWTTSPTHVGTSITPSFAIVRLHVDGENERWRLELISENPTTDTTRGIRTHTLTDWVNWSATRARSNTGEMRMAWGHYPNGAANKDAELEYVRVSVGAPVFLHGNGKDGIGGPYEAYSAYALGDPDQAGGWIPCPLENTNTPFIPLGSGGSSDDADIRGRSVAAKTWPVQASDTVYAAYGGSDGATRRVHFASATLGADLLPGAWTKDGSNPYWTGQFPYLVYYDGTWYCFYAIPGSPIEIALRTTTAATPIGATWTDQGVILSASVTGWDSEHVNQPVALPPVPGRQYWVMYFAGAEAGIGPGSSTVWGAGYATTAAATDPLDPTLGFRRDWDAVPDGIITQTNLSGAIGDLDDDPDDPDGNWWTIVADGDTVAHVSVGTPSRPLLAGADLQEIRVLVRKNAAGGADPDVQVHLYESGNGGNPLASTSVVSVTSETGQVVSLTFDRTLLTDATGADLEVRVEGTANGGGPNERSVEVGAIEFNPGFAPLRAWDDAPGTQVDGAVSGSAFVTLDSTADLADDDPVSTTDDGTNSNYLLQRIRRVINGTDVELYGTITISDNAAFSHSERGSPYFMDVKQLASGKWVATGTHFRGHLGDHGSTYVNSSERSGLWLADDWFGPWVPAGLSDEPLLCMEGSNGRLHGWENVGMIHPPGIAAVVVSLSPDELAHGQTIDRSGPTQTHQATPADLTHPEAIDAIALATAYGIMPRELTHGHTLDRGTAAQIVAAAARELVLAHALDRAAVSGVPAISAADIFHGHAIDGTTLGLLRALVAREVAHAAPLEAAEIDSAHGLAGRDLDHTLALDPSDILKANDLVATEVLHAHGVDRAGIAGAAALTAADALLAWLADGAPLLQSHAITPSEVTHALLLERAALAVLLGVGLTAQGLTHAHTAARPAIAQDAALTAAEVLSSTLLSGAGLTGMSALSPDALLSAVGLEAVATSVTGALTAQDVESACSLEAPALTVFSALLLVAQDLSHGHAVDRASATHALALGLRDLLHAQAVDGGELSSVAALTAQDVLSAVDLEAAAWAAALVGYFTFPGRLVGSYGLPGILTEEFDGLRGRLR